MTPKKTITIGLVLFLIMVAALSFLYYEKQSVVPKTEPINVGAGQNKPLTPSDIIQQKINKIIEDAKKNPAQNTPASIRQKIVDTINQGIINYEQNKTPEQAAADLKAEAERQKIIDQINNQIIKDMAKPKSK